MATVIKERIRICLRLIALALIALMLTWLLGANDGAVIDDVFAIFKNERSADSASDESDDIHPEIDWNYWEGLNEDIVGWVHVPGTRISEPIVQADASDATFYLDHDIAGSEDAKGCAFLDPECKAQGLLSINSVIFGHHLSTGHGFSDFAKFADEEFADAHATISLQCRQWKKRLNAILVQVIDAKVEKKATSFAGAKQFNEWISRQRENCILDAVESSGRQWPPSRIWTFCTCSYSTYADERTLVIASEA